MAHKPFVLPRQDPSLYVSLLKSMCVPGLVTGRVPVPESALARAARSTDSVILDPSVGSGTQVEAPEPWQQAGR
jgi:hypothetical protein